MSRKKASSGNPRREDLRARLDFEKVLTALSAKFINLPFGSVDREIAKGLKEISISQGIDRMTLMELAPDRTRLLITHSWAGEGYPPLPKTLTNQMFPWFTERILAGKDCVIEKIDDFPEDANHEKEFAVKSGTKSLLAIPMTVGGTVVGAIGYATLGRLRLWPEEQLQRFRLVGGIFANALDRRRSGQDLRASEERFRKVFEDGPLGMALIDSDFRMIKVNRKFCEILGYDEAQLTGCRFQEVTHPEDIEKDVELAQRLFMGEIQSYSIQKRYVKKDSEVVFASLTSSVVRDENGEILYGLGMVDDVTDRMTAEEKAGALSEELLHVSRLATLGELEASLAHEISQPLTAILSNAQAAQRFLESENPDLEEIREILSDIVENDKRAVEVIRRVRSLTKRGAVTLCPMDLNRAVREIAKLVEKETTVKQSPIRLDLARDLPPVKGDRVHLQQLLLNLILNAAQATRESNPDDRSVIIRTVRENAEVVGVSVRDHGTGIPEEDMDRVFQPFFSTKKDGLGMGLAICKSIIEGHNGRIWVENHPDGGACFQFTIPFHTRGLH